MREGLGVGGSGEGAGMAGLGKGSRESTQRGAH